MKAQTKKAVDKALDDYENEIIEGATATAVRAHIAGDMTAYTSLGMPIAENLVQQEALVYGEAYRELLRTRGSTVIQGKEIEWLSDHTEGTRESVYSTIEAGLREGKPVGVRGASGPGTIAHDMKNLAIRDKDFEYTRIARTETARIQNRGTLNRYTKSNITHVNVIDGDGCEECEAANGQVWTVAYAADHELAHPNCVRAFSPVIQDDWEPPEESNFDDSLTDRDLPILRPIDLIRDVEGAEAMKQDLLRSEMQKRGWKSDSGIFSKGKIDLLEDKFHMTNDGQIFAITRGSIDKGSLALKGVEVNTGVQGQYARVALRDRVEDAMTRGVTDVRATAWKVEEQSIFKEIGMRQLPSGVEFKGDMDWMLDLVGRKTVHTTKKESARMARYVRKLDKDDVARYRHAATEYTAKDYETINTILREGIDSDEVLKKWGAEAVKNAKQCTDDLSEYMTGAPKFKGRVYRGLKFDDKADFDNFMGGVRSNKQMQMPSFTSTSMDRDISDSFMSGLKGYNVELQVESKSGVYLGGLSEFGSEAEVLFNPGARFEIQSVIKVNRMQYRVTLKDLGTT